MEARDYLRLFRRRWWLIASIAFLGASFAWLTAPAAVAPKIQRFAATHTLIVEPESRQWTPENPATIALLATSDEVPRRVAARLGMPEDDGDALVGSMTIQGDPTLAIISVRATTGNAARSEMLADAFAEELVTYLDEQENAARLRQINAARTRADDLVATIEDVSNRIVRGDGDPSLLAEQRLVYVNQYGDAEALYQSLISQPAADSGLKSLGPAHAAEVDAGIHAPRGRTERAAILGMIGLVLALALVTVLERLDVRMKTKEEVEAAFRLPVIAEIPPLPLARRRAREVISHLEPASSIAEAYRGLRTTLLILQPTPITPPAIGGGDPARRRATDHVTERDAGELRAQQVFLITSTRPSEGKTTSVANLAAVFAEAGRSVLVVGADIRRPVVHEYFGVARSPGVTEVLMGGPGAPSLADVVVPTTIPGVSVVPAGAHVSNPGELLLQGTELIDAARELADIILVDATPLLTVNDAVQFMPSADAVIIACRAGRSTIDAARRAPEILARLRVPVAGIILVGASETPGVPSYYYGYQTRSTVGPMSSLRRHLRRWRGAAPPAPPAPAAPASAPAEPVVASSPVRVLRTDPAVSPPPAVRERTGPREPPSTPAPPDSPAAEPADRAVATTTNGSARVYSGNGVPAGGERDDPWAWP